MVTANPAILPWHRPSLTGPVLAAAPARAEQALEKPNAENGEGSGFNPFGEDGFSFLDLIDVINPLQHIPVIGTLYREMTGDTIDPLPRIAGSTLFFGPVGAAFSTANVLLEETSGADLGDHVMAMLRDEDSTTNTAALTNNAAEGQPKGVSVIAQQPAAAGTDAETGIDDPVTSWARAELAYRQGLAQDQAAARSSVKTADASSDLSWTKSSLVIADKPAATPELNTQAPIQSVPDVARFIDALDTKHRAVNLAALDQAGLTSEKNIPGSAAPKAKRITEAYQAASTLPASPVASRADPAPFAGAAAAGGGWFSTNLLETFDRYQSLQMSAAGAAPGSALAPTSRKTN
jgi:hypothetical protein